MSSEIFEIYRFNNLKKFLGKNDKGLRKGKEK